MRNRYQAFAVLGLALSLFSCGGKEVKKGTDKPEVYLIHPVDTGKILDTASVKRNKAYTLEEQNDGGIGYDAGDSPEQSIPWPMGKPSVGLVGTEMDQADEYRIEVPEGKKTMVSFVTGKTSHNLNLEIWDNEMREIWSQFDMEPDAEVTFEFPEGTKGTHYLIVSHSYGGGPYKILFKEKEPY
jgi:hypothetical protein